MNVLPIPTTAVLMLTAQILLVRSLACVNLVIAEMVFSARMLMNVFPTCTNVTRMPFVQTLLGPIHVNVKLVSLEMDHTAEVSCKTI